MKKLMLMFLVLIVGSVGYLLLSPDLIDAAAYEAPDGPPLDGVTASNELLRQAELLAVGEVYGPEDIAVDSQGLIYGGTQDGKIIRVWPDGKVETWVETQGRPLGLHFDKAGNLIVCDAWKGLLSIDPAGNVKVLATEADGVKFRFTDDLDIASDGMIYFTDASSRFDQPDYMLDAFEARPYGRLMVYDPENLKTHVLLDNLYFANGVALSSNEDFVLVNETYRYRITRYWLKGPKAGTSDTFIDNLPGFPDGVSSNREGIFWVALPSLRIPFLDRIHPMPVLKNWLIKLPDWMKPKVIPYGFVLALNEQGEIVRSLHDTSGKYLQEITSVEQVGPLLYLGTLHNDRIGRLPVKGLLPEATP